MKNIEQQFDNILDFNNRLTDDSKNNFQELLIFLDDFNKIYKEEEKKLPYHINLIDELHANENAHSRILEKLLQQQKPTNKKYEILESFLEFIKEKYYNKEDFNKINIQKPQITQEKERIDLWIRDFDYTIVLENKVAWASDQPNQLERYIDITKKYGFKDKEEQIYVLYLPPTYEKEPTKQTWGKYYKSDIRTKRYLNLSFKDDILPWLKNLVLPNIRLKDKYLSSSIEQYIDHLEGKFSLRTINNTMNMELQSFIRETLRVNYIESEKALEIVSIKIQEMENALTQLNTIKEDIQKELDEKYFSMCYEELKQQNLAVVRKVENYPEYFPRSVGIKIVNNLTVWIGKDFGVKGEWFCQLNSNDKKTMLSEELKNEFKDVVGHKKVEGDSFLIWKWFVDKDKAFDCLNNLCKKFSNITIKT